VNRIPSDELLLIANKKDEELFPEVSRQAVSQQPVRRGG